MGEDDIDDDEENAPDDEDLEDMDDEMDLEYNDSSNKINDDDDDNLPEPVQHMAEATAGFAAHFT